MQDGNTANLDLQDKVRTVVCMSNERWYVLHPVKPGAIVTLLELYV